MSKTFSHMIPLGTIAPSFNLTDVRLNKKVSLNDYASSTATVIMFICNHCPFVKLIQSHLTEVAKTYQKKGIAFIAISSNDVDHYPEDSPEKMQELAQQLGFTFPYLYDETQEVAKAYQAACTPDFYIFDKQLACVYRGRFDDATPGNGLPVTGKDLTSALDAILNHQTINAEQTPSVGCNIKWKN